MSKKITFSTATYKKLLLAGLITDPSEIEHAIAVLLSLLDPAMVSAYLNGTTAVSEDYVINPANFVDYPDVLGLFNNKHERIEFYVFLNTLPENHTLRFDLYNFLGFLLGNNRFVKTALLGMVAYVLTSTNSTRDDASVLKLFRSYHMDHDFFIYETINEEVNNLWEFVYFAICYSADNNIMVAKTNGKRLSEFKKVGRAIADTYIGYKNMLESEPCLFLVYDEIKYKLAVKELPHYLIVNFYYSVVEEGRDINLKTLAMVSEAINWSQVSNYSGNEEAFKHLHLDPVSFIKQQKNIHSIALECVDELPINNLTKIYKNIVDFSEGRTTMFYLESAQYII